MLVAYSGAFNVAATTTSANKGQATKPVAKATRAPSVGASTSTLGKASPRFDIGHFFKKVESGPSASPMALCPAPSDPEHGSAPRGRDRPSAAAGQSVEDLTKEFGLDKTKAQFEQTSKMFGDGAFVDYPPDKQKFTAQGNAITRLFTSLPKGIMLISLASHQHRVFLT